MTEDQAAGSSASFLQYNGGSSRGSALLLKESGTSKLHGKNQITTPAARTSAPGDQAALLGSGTSRWVTRRDWTTKYRQAHMKTMLQHCHTGSAPPARFRPLHSP